MAKNILFALMISVFLSPSLTGCKGAKSTNKKTVRTPPQTTLEYVQRIPGLRATQYQLSFRNGRVLTVLDGVVVQYTSLLNMVNVRDIQSGRLLKEPVDILRYTTEAVTGILVIKTK